MTGALSRGLGVVSLSTLVIWAWACTDNPHIDGSKVPKIGDPDAGVAPTCAQACDRLASLCGYAPPSCTTDDAGGYCDVNFDSDHLLCVGQAGSCQEAWDCQNAPPPGDAGDEGTTDDGATDDGSGDAATE